MTEIHNGRSDYQPRLPAMSLDELELAIREARADEQAKQLRRERLYSVLDPSAIATPSASLMDGQRPYTAATAPAQYAEMVVSEPEVAPVIGRDMIINGDPHHLSADMDNETRKKFIAAEKALGNRVDYELIDRKDDFTAFNGADQQELNRMLQDDQPGQVTSADKARSMKDRLDSSIVGSGGYNKVSRFKITRKKILAGVAILAASGGVVYATNPSMFTSESAQASLTPGADAEAESVIANETDTGIKLTARDIAIGDCLDDAGNGKALVQGKVAITADVKWKIKMIDGSEDVVMDEGGLFPKLSIPDATVNLANCITPEKRDAAVKVGENNVVEINYDAIEQQIGIVAGATAPTSEAWELEPVAGLTDQASVADITSSMQNSKENVEIAVPIAQAQAGAGFTKEAATVEKAHAAMQAKLEADINARVAGLFAAQKSPVDKVTVKFVGTPKGFVYKGPAAPESKKFAVEKIEPVYAINAETKQ